MTSRLEIVGGNTRGQTIEIGAHDELDAIYGGAFLINCTVNIRGARFTIKDANFLNCLVSAAEAVEGVRFLETVFERTKFEGSFCNCQFGFRRGESHTPNAYYRNCDFSGARLDNCLFFTGDVDSVIWPAWPNFAILNPQTNKINWQALAFPPEYALLRELLTTNEPDAVGFDNQPLALTVDAGAFQSGSADLESLRVLLGSEPYVMFNEKPRA